MVCTIYEQNKKNKKINTCTSIIRGKNQYESVLNLKNTQQISDNVYLKKLQKLQTQKIKSLYSFCMSNIDTYF